MGDIAAILPDRTPTTDLRALVLHPGTRHALALTPYTTVMLHEQCLMHIYTDGSYHPDGEAWANAILLENPEPHGHSNYFVGVSAAYIDQLIHDMFDISIPDNNTADLVAIFHSLTFFTKHADHVPRLHLHKTPTSMPRC